MGAVMSSTIGGSTTQGEGTSYAAPHVAGIAALLLSALPSATASQIRSMLESSASPLPDQGMGKGLVNAAAAIQQVLSSSVSVGDGLSAINTLSADALVARFGLLAITAALLIAHRPFQRLDDIRGTLGLTDEQFAALSTPPSSPSGDGEDGLEAINTNDAATLVARFGLLPFTAELIVSKRPYRSLEDIRNTLGLTDQQFAALLGSS
jgi:DNA uptake protein ComE-like DNA-binding protein